MKLINYKKKTEQLESVDNSSDINYNDQYVPSKLIKFEEKDASDKMFTFNVYDDM